MSAPPSELRRRLAPWGFALFAALVAVVFYKVALPFVLALMLAYVLAPVVTRLSRVSIGRRTMPRALAVVICYLGILGALALFFGGFLPRLSGDFARLVKAAPPFFQRVRTDYVPRLTTWIEANFPSEDEEARGEGPRAERKIAVTQTAPGRYDISLEGVDLQIEHADKERWVIGPNEGAGAGRFSDLVGRLARTSETQAMELLKLSQRFVTGVIKGVAKLILILMLTAFILVDIERIMAFVRGLVPAQHRVSWDEVVVEMDRGLAGVIRGQFLICLVNGVLTYIGLLIFNVKYSLVLGILAGGMSLIPVFGSILSSVPIVAIALVSGGPGGVSLTKGAAVLGWIIGIHLVEANYLNPKIIGGAAKIHPLLVVFSLLVGENTGGLVGALIAVPIASMVQTLFLYFRRRAAAVDGRVTP